MPSKRHYEIAVSNSYLGKSRVFRGTIKKQVEFLANEQIKAWQLEETQKRQQDYQKALHTQAQMQQQAIKRQEQNQLLELSVQAERSNKEAQEKQIALRELLHRGLGMGKRFDWNAYINSAPYPPFQFTEPPPSYEQVARMLNVPAPKPAIEAIFADTRRKREKLEFEARNQLNLLSSQYEARKAEAFRQHEEKRLTFERERAHRHAEVEEKRRRLDAGDAEVLTWFLKNIFADLVFPAGYGKEVEVAFDTPSGTAIVEMFVPNPGAVSNVTGYTFVKSRKVIEPVVMKPKDFDTFYDSIICQMALLTVHRCFRECTSPALQAVVFNGWVRGIDKATGKEFTSCIVSVRVERETFQGLNLEQVDPKECIRNLKGRVTAALAQLAPVSPVMKLDTRDKRFIESKEVLDHLSDGENLATMDWEDFEHLVRELFSKIFSGENTEVRVTQSSRDGGVDAVVFDPDPLRGGKYVIQAKRYNHVVPVSAVRDLHGTMDHERATRGFLVTTSHFGNDAREFVKDKPSITLVDGNNLVALLQQHGYSNIRIQLQSSNSGDSNA